MRAILVLGLAWAAVSASGMPPAPPDAGRPPDWRQGPVPGRQPAPAPAAGPQLACPADPKTDIGFARARAIAERATRPGPVGHRLVLERPGHVLSVTAHRAGEGLEPPDFEPSGIAVGSRYYLATIAGDMKLIPPFSRGGPSSGTPKCLLTLWICGSNGFVVRLRAAPCPQRPTVPQAHP